MATLDLNTSPRTAVFRKLEEIIRNDPTMRRIFRPTSLRWWNGKPQDSAPFTIDVAPAARFTPINGPDLWRFPEAFAGDLFLNVELLVKGTDVDDVFNLWHAIQRAIYPKGSGMANVQALQQAGALKGTCEFTQVAFDPTPSDNFFAASGQIKIQIRDQLMT